MANWIDNIKKNDELLEFLKVLLTIIVFPLYLWYLSTNPVDYNNIKTVCTLICLWILLIIVVLIHVINSNSVEYKLGVIGTFIIPVILCYLVYSNLNLDSLIVFFIVTLYLIPFSIYYRQSINGIYSKIIHFIYIIPFLIAFLYNYGNLFYHNTSFIMFIISTWFIIFLFVLPYTQKLKEKNSSR
jgi:hypothetical protein